jgi:hypothetical protein
MLTHERAGNLGYALTILKIFDRRFYRSATTFELEIHTRADARVVGLLYAMLGGMLYVISFLRARHSLHDFADGWQNDPRSDVDAIPTVGQESTRVYGRPFKTAGVYVVAVAVAVAAIEVALLVSIFNL